MTSRQSNREIIAWVGTNIVPLEAGLRARLRGLRVPDGEIDDIVQEAYLAFARLESIDHIRQPQAYLYSTARNVMLQRVRRQRIVRIDSVGDVAALEVIDETPGPERRVMAMHELDRVQRLITALPDRCREIFTLRRINGVSQREIAERMGISEKVVEAQAIRGLKLLLRAIEHEDDARRRSSGRTDDIGRDHDRRNGR